MKTIPQLHYELIGSGPTVVLLHGYMASSKYWQGVIDKLARSHQVIALDLLGFGKSPKPAFSKYDFAAQITSINATLDSLHLTKPFTLVGHSMGSLVALRYARDYPAQVQKLLLTNMPVLLNQTDAKAEIFGTNIWYRIGLTPGLHTIIWPIFRSLVALRILPSKVAEGAIHRRNYMFQSTGISRIRSMRNVIFAAKIDADLRAIQATTVLLSGLQDRKRYLTNLASLQLQAHVKAIAVPGGHHLPLSKPELITEHI